MMVMMMMLMTFIMPVEDDSEGDYNDDNINYSVMHCVYLGNIGRVLDGEIVNDDKNLTWPKLFICDKCPTCCSWRLPSCWCSSCADLIGGEEIASGSAINLSSIFPFH